MKTLHRQQRGMVLNSAILHDYTEEASREVATIYHSY